MGYLTGRGVPWWTAAEINAWERGRRLVKWSVGEGGWSVSAEDPLKGATVLTGPTEVGERYGFRFEQRVIDLERGQTYAIRQMIRHMLYAREEVCDG